MTTLEKIRAEIDGLYEGMTNYYDNRPWMLKDKVLEIIDKYAEQEPCDDAISRQAVLDELNKWEWQELYLPIHFKENIIDVVPSVRPQEPKIVKYGWTKIPKCTTCKYWYSPIVPCSRCKDNSEFKPQESEEISERNMKMWQDIFEEEKRRAE